MAGFEALVDELERSYRETQERMSDPAVYGDRRGTGYCCRADDGTADDPAPRSAS